MLLDTRSPIYQMTLGSRCTRHPFGRVRVRAWYNFMVHIPPLCFTYASHGKWLKIRRICGLSLPENGGESPNEGPGLKDVTSDEFGRLQLRTSDPRDATQQQVRSLPDETSLP